MKAPGWVPVLSSSMMMVVSEQREIRPNGICWTDSLAFAAADAFSGADFLRNVQLHRAVGGAFAALNAFVLRDLHLIACKAVEQCVKCTERTQIPAEHTRNFHSQHHYYEQDGKLP